MAADMKSSKRSYDSMTTEMNVRLEIGTEKAIVMANSGVLSVASERFSAELSRWSEGQHGVIKLCDEKPEEIEMMIDVLHFRKFLDTTNALVLAPLFVRFCMQTSLIDKVQDIITDAISDDYEDVLCNSFFKSISEEYSLSRAYLHIVKVCVDSNFEDLLGNKDKLGVVCKVFLRDETSIFVFNDIDHWYELMEPRYITYFNLFWDRVRPVVLSETQMDEKLFNTENLNVESVKLFWPIISTSFKRVRHWRHFENALLDIFIKQKVCTYDNARTGAFHRVLQDAKRHAEEMMRL